MKSFTPIYIYFGLLFCFINFIYSIDNEEDFIYDLSLATQGVTVSQYNTGVNYYIGRGIDKDLEKAVYWYQMASEEGHSKAPFNIGIIYANGEVTDKDLTLALEYFLLSEERGNKEAKKFIKLLKLNGGSNLEESLAEICCPEPLSHSMVSKN